MPSVLLMSNGLELVLGFAAIGGLLLLSGLVSGSEVAFFSLTPNDYEEMEQENNPVRGILYELREKPRLLLATILIANNFINIAIVLVSEIMLSKIFPDALFANWARTVHESVNFMRQFSEAELSNAIGFLITVIGVTFLLVLFGEVAPKVYASYNKVKLATRMAGPINFLMRVLHPIASSLVQGASFIERRLENHTLDAAAASQEDIDEAIDLTVNADDGGDENQRQDVDILKRIVKFNNVTVRQIMRARGDVVAVESKIDYQQLIAVVRESSYSRIPVFEEDFDKIKGILYVKDLLGHRHEPPDFDWIHLVKEDVLFVPENKKISDLLKEFQTEKTHMAIVVDEYGGTEGIVTLEDVLEEVIGDIQDEFDEEEEIVYQRIDELNFVFEGKTMLNDVYRILKIPAASFEPVKGEAESLGGLVLEILGRIPEAGEEIAFDGYRFQAMSVNTRRIEEVLITLPEPPESDTPSAH
ncbi:gliding motility-associated protein GldE [Lewinella marina]|uniref:gliding motility-associated protein GldE n=1 Tax=Neolewinella marina TaxID=438751 RepID=UPI0016B6128A|nr:gliding motility-associated protein GldE [Neolewinella marina]NJB87055.1 gliding motility-associated protein GldE [Neolewinella marina]